MCSSDLDDGNATLFSNLNLTTSNESDVTPPEILNLAVDTALSGDVVCLEFTWYTNEATTETVDFLDATLEGDVVALKKNHEMVFCPDPALQAGTYSLTVTAVDASGNANTSSVDFTLTSDQTGGDTGQTGGEDGTAEDCPEGEDCSPAEIGRAHV